MNPPPATRRRILTESKAFALEFKDFISKTMDIEVPLDMGMIICGYLFEEELKECGRCHDPLYLEECNWWLEKAYCRGYYKEYESYNFFSFSDSEEDEDDDLIMK